MLGLVCAWQGAITTEDQDKYEANSPNAHWQIINHVRLDQLEAKWMEYQRVCFCCLQTAVQPDQHTGNPETSWKTTTLCTGRIHGSVTDGKWEEDVACLKWNKDPFALTEEAQRMLCEKKGMPLRVFPFPYNARFMHRVSFVR